MKIDTTSVLKNINIIGKGVDGNVYIFEDKVIKISKINNDNLLYDNFSNTQLNILYLMNNDIKCYPIIYDFKFIKFDNNSIFYYTILEKLNNLSIEENKVFHSILSHEDRNINKDYSLEYINSILIEMNKYIEFDRLKVLLFCMQYKNSIIKHCDIHERNIMKDNDGNFKFIDLDRLKVL